MSLESATYINQLNALNPDGTDLVSTADDHLRLIKSVLKNTFPNVTGPVTASQDALNGQSYLVDTGTANAVVLSPSPAWTSYPEGRGFTFKCINNTTTATPTINVSGLGAKTVVLSDGNPAVLYANSVYEVTYNGAAFVLKNATNKKIISDIVTWQPASVTYTGIRSTGNLRLGANSLDYLHIDTTGKIGVGGITAPVYALDILGTEIQLWQNTSTCSLLLGDQTNNGSIFGSTSQIGISSTTSGNKIAVGRGATSDIDITVASGSTPFVKVKRTNNLIIGGTFNTPISAVNIAATDNVTSGYANIFELRNDGFGSANTSKFIRLSPLGSLEVRNSANSKTIMSLSDSGVLTLDVASGGGIDASSISGGQLPTGITAVQCAINDSSYKLATTNFVNRSSNVSTSPSGYNWYTTPSGHTILWSNVTLNANATLKVTLSAISSTFTGKTIVSLMNTIQSLTGNTQDYYSIKMLIGANADLGTFSIINTTGVATPIFYQVVMV